MSKTWINRKPETKNAIWSSATARTYRARHNEKEKELKHTLDTLGFPELYGNLLASDGLEGLTKAIKQIKTFKKTLNSSIAKGYVIEEPVLTVEEEKIAERKERESVIDENLLSNLKKEIGHGRPLQKFKFDNEMRGKFNRNALDTYPVIFLQVPTIRNTLKHLYENIDLSTFDLKQKEIEALRPKEMSEREYNKQIAEIEKEKEAKKKKKQKPTPEPESEEDKPSAERIIANVDNSEYIESTYEKLTDASDDDDHCRYLPKPTIQKRMNRNIRDSNAFRAALASPDRTPNEIIDLQVNLRTTESASKKYKVMLRDFDKNEKERNLGLSEEQLLLREIENDSDDAWSYDPIHIVRDYNTNEVIDLNDFYHTSKQPQDSNYEEKDLTPGQIKQIEVELKIYLGVTDGWILEHKDDDDDTNEFKHYLKGPQRDATVIVPSDFKELIHLQKSERFNEYSHIMKRLSRHPKLNTLASACKSHPKSIEKAFEKCFAELKKVLKAP